MHNNFPSLLNGISMIDFNYNFTAKMLAVKIIKSDCKFAEVKSVKIWFFNFGNQRGKFSIRHKAYQAQKVDF